MAVIQTFPSCSDRLYPPCLGSFKGLGRRRQRPIEDADSMRDLGDAAIAILSLPGSTYGPAFQLVAVTPSATPPAGNFIPVTSANLRAVPKRAHLASAPAGRSIVAAVSPGVSYARVQQLLDEAIHGENIGAPGPFCPTLTRDQLVTNLVFCKSLTAKRRMVLLIRMRRTWSKHSKAVPFAPT